MGRTAGLTNVPSVCVCTAFSPSLRAGLGHRVKWSWGLPPLHPGIDTWPKLADQNALCSDPSDWSRSGHVTQLWDSQSFPEVLGGGTGEEGPFLFCLKITQLGTHSYSSHGSSSGRKLIREAKCSYRETWIVRKEERMSIHFVLYSLSWLPYCKS